MGELKAHEELFSSCCPLSDLKTVAFSEQCVQTKHNDVTHCSTMCYHHFSPKLCSFFYTQAGTHTQTGKQTHNGITVRYYTTTTYDTLIRTTACCVPEWHGICLKMLGARAVRTLSAPRGAWRGPMGLLTHALIVGSEIVWS